MSKRDVNWKGMPLVIFGSGGISREVLHVIDAINKTSNNQIYDVLGFVDKELSERANCRLDIVTTDDGFAEFASRFPLLAVVIPIGSPNLKKKIHENIKNIDNIIFPNIIHPNTDVDISHVRMGKGNIICNGVSCTVDIEIGNFNLINLNCTIGHDVSIGDYNVINPLSSISGNIIINDSSLIGTGASILQGLEVGSESTVGAGAVVTKNVVNNVTVVGVPAKVVS